VDGHRLSSTAVASTPMQSDLNGIPLAAIERIEVLPTTASGIYGGSATGGVVNVVLRRDYQGIESKVTYENTFDSDAEIRQVDLAAGFNFNNGDTSLLFAGSFSDATPLRIGERDLAQRGRSEILANNPAFFYGAASPPLGATPNLRSVGGVNLTLDDGTPLHSPITHVPAGYAGFASDQGAALVDNAGTYNFDLANSAQFFGNSGGANQYLTTDPTIKAVSATLRHRFSSRVQLFLDVGASRNETESVTSVVPNTLRVAASAPNNPFAQDVIVSFPTNTAEAIYRSRNESKRAVAGAIIDLSRGWTAGVDYTWSRSKYVQTQSLGPNVPTLTAAVLNGTVNTLVDTQLFPPDLAPYFNLPPDYSRPGAALLKDATARVSGPVWTLPAGAATLSAAVEHRDESNGEGGQITFYFPATSQQVDSAYLELRLPFASASHELFGIRELELQLAGRFDRYRTDGANLALATSTAPIARGTNEVHATNPTVALQFRPVQDLALRASYGTGFLPPAVNQLVSAQSTGAVFVDPLRGNTQVITPLGSNTSGGNSGLKPEKSTSWSAGFIWTPRWAPAARLSVDYVHIEKEDNIAAPTAQQLVDHPDIFPGRVVRGPKLSTDPADWAGPVIATDTRLANFARAELRAYDISLDYGFETQRFGSIAFNGIATWQTYYETQFLPDSPLVDNVGVGRNNPLKLKANGGLRWTLGAWSAGWSTRYFHSYLVADPAAASSAPVILNQGGARIPSQVYHDVFVTHRGTVNGFAWLNSMAVTAGIKNVFDTRPPFDASNANSAYYSTFGDARLASYYISFSLGF
jgi:outer membrane receptor protein involved in Fe transport